MKIVVSKEGFVSVDGVTRQIDTGDLDPQIEVLAFDTLLGEGLVQYVEEAKISASVRDLAAESLENQRRAEQNLLPLEEPLYKSVMIHRPVDKLEDFTPYQKYLQAWQAWKPPDNTPPPPTPEQQTELDRLSSIDDEIRQAAFGVAQPATLQELKAMSRAQYVAWFNTNFNSAATLFPLIRRMFLLLLRRVL